MRIFRTPFFKNTSGWLLLNFLKASLLYKLGDSWIYMPPILVPSSAKPITSQILVIAKLNRRKYIFLRALFRMSSIPTRSYLFKVSNWKTRISELFKIKNEDTRTMPEKINTFENKCVMLLHGCSNLSVTKIHEQ